MSGEFPKRADWNNELNCTFYKYKVGKIEVLDDSNAYGQIKLDDGSLVFFDSICFDKALNRAPFVGEIVKITFNSVNAITKVSPYTRDTRPSWNQFFLQLAQELAKRSTCLRAPKGIGCVIVRDNRILATGYGGSLPKQPHCTEVGCLIENGGCVRTTHAEANAIALAAAEGISLASSTAYVTMSPCLTCFKLLISSGIKIIRFGEEYRITEPQRTWAKEMGVEYCQIQI